MISQNLASTFGSDVIFVNEFLRAERKWAPNFCENWVMQHEAADKSIEFFKTFRYYRMRARHTWKMNLHVIMLMRLHCKTKPRITSRIRKITLKITAQKREQENAYVKTFMNLKNAHTLSHQQESLIEQKMKRYAIKSDSNFRKTLNFECH